MCCYRNRLLRLHHKRPTEYALNSDRWLHSPSSPDLVRTLVKRQLCTIDSLYEGIKSSIQAEESLMRVDNYMYCMMLLLPTQ